MTEHFHYATTTPYAGLVAEFKRDTFDTSYGGRKTRANPKTGATEVDDGMGGWVSVAVAKRAGLIS